jgi:hypothetical protein
MIKSVKIKIYKTMVKPVVVYGSEMWPVTGGCEKTKYVGVENIMEDIWSSGRMRVIVKD